MLKNVRKLERELGVPLIRRAQNFEGLTPEGEQLVRWARRLLADRASMTQEAATLKEGLSGDLRLGVVPGAVVAAHGVRLDPRIETDAIAGLIALARTGRWATIVPATWLSDAETAGLRAVRLDVAGAHVALVRADAEPASVLTAAFEREVRDARAVHP